MEPQPPPKSSLQSLRIDEHVYRQLVIADNRLKHLRGGKQISALFCRSIELGIDRGQELHQASRLQSTDHKQTTVRIPTGLLDRVRVVGGQINLRPAVVMRAASLLGLPLLMVEVEAELAANAQRPDVVTSPVTAPGQELRA
jgi:hypothetical protein